MDTYKVHPLFSRRQRKRVSPLPVVAATAATALSSQPQQQPYKTIKEEAAEFKAKMLAMREREAMLGRACAKQKKKQPREKPANPRESRLHREPSQFSGVFTEWWSYRVELMKYHYSRFKQNTLPTIFCLRAEVDDQE